MNGDPIVPPVREFDRFVFAVSHKLLPTDAATRHLTHPTFSGFPFRFA
jgi:hypothetical protein